MIFLVLGFMELVVGILLVDLGRQVPSKSEVEQSFHSAQRVTEHAGDQVRLLHRQVATFQQMELQQLSEHLQQQTHTLTATLRSQSVDFDTVCTLRDALGEAAAGLNGLADTLDPDAIGKLSTGLRDTASFLDEKVIPSAEKAANHFDESTAALRDDARRLCALLTNSPPDLKALREVYDSMGRFQAGLDKMSGSLKMQRLDAVRDGIHGLERSLSAGAEEVERLSKYSSPVVVSTGMRPDVQQRPFWPEGSKIAKGMRKASAGAAAAGKEMDGMAADLPRIRESVVESCKMVGKVREALGLALQHEDKVGPLLKEVPIHASRLVEELPKLGLDLSRILRETQRLKEVVAALREAQKGIDAAVGRWPQIRITLQRLASGLRAARNQLNKATEHRQEYETAMKQTVQLADTFASMLPLISDQLDGRLEEEDQTLTDLGDSLDQVREAIPAYSQTATRLLHTGRILAWLVAGIVGLHGCYLIVGARMGRRYSI